MRARARWGIAPLLAAPAGAWALGLGDIELKSALNQPFRADIALSATTEEMQSLRIALASADMFAKYGLDRPAFLTNFEFRVAADGAGRKVIQVTSRESVAEPFLTLLVEATWPRGRTLREYTVLLDPPVLLPGPATSPAVQPAETRTSSGAGGPIDRPAPRTPAPATAPAPEPAAPPRPVSSAVTEPAPGPVSNAAPAAPRAPAVAPGGTYGPVQRAETLWAISERMRPDGITINQMMIAIYEANAAAFGGNINFLRAGATLRIPESADLEALTRTAANAEVQRHTDEWQNRSPGGQLRLLPPTDTAVARNTEPAPAPAPRDTSAPPAADRDAAAAAAAAAADAEESRRLVELRNEELRNLQEQAAAAAEPEDASPDNADSAAPGVDLEVFADEESEVAPVEEQPVVAPVPTPAPVASGPSLVSQALGYLRSPLLWIVLGVAVLLFGALWFVRRRRQETEDVTGRWEALQAETDEDTRDATERMRRQLAEETIVVEEQHAQSLRPSPEPEPPARRGGAPAAPAPRGQRSAPASDETLSSQTVINLDQADAIAEADFHVAYGLYDQAAELVQKAIETAPERRDLKLKLLEVFFMWGNKDAFLKSARALRGEIGQAEDSDWDKVVIMGRQICPDERLFTEATTGGGRVDVDLQAGDSPLDLAFDDAAAADVDAAAGGLDFQLESSDQRPAPKPATKTVKGAPARGRNDDMLDIGSKTAAGLEAALFAPMGDDDDTGARTSPDIPDVLAVTQESPTIERPGRSDWATAESPTLHSAEAPTVETPTLESPAARSSTTGVTKTVAMPRRHDSPTVEQPALGTVSGEYTAEIDLDDLGLDVKDLEGLPGDLGDLPMAAGNETDTREQKALRDDDGLLSATGVTKVLHEDDLTGTNTSVMEDQDATMLAPGFDEGTSTLTGTEVLEGRHQAKDDAGNTSLVRSLRAPKDAADLDLADLTAALHGADTVEQPRTQSFSRDVFGGGSTPLDLDIGNDPQVADDDPTGTEEVSPLDPQTMTEVGTKLDLARAYIDMGDPEGARSILEEVLDEGDSNQRREAQGLIDVLSA